MWFGIILQTILPGYQIIQRVVIIPPTAHISRYKQFRFLIQCLSKVAYELDEALMKFSDEITEGKYPGITSHVGSEEDVNRFSNLLVTLILFVGSSMFSVIKFGLL